MKSSNTTKNFKKIISGILASMLISSCSTTSINATDDFLASPQINSEMTELENKLDEDKNFLPESGVLDEKLIADNPSPYVSNRKITHNQKKSVKISYRTVNYGGQQEVDACLGGLTNFTQVSNYLNKPYLAIHDTCGGRPIGDLQLGDRVMVDGKIYKVVSMMNTRPGDKASVLKDLKGQIILQTCIENNLMRDVGLTKILYPKTS